jgi:hypothetical protein
MNHRSTFLFIFTKYLHLKKIQIYINSNWPLKTSLFLKNVWYLVIDSILIYYMHEVSFASLVLLATGIIIIIVN